VIFTTVLSSVLCAVDILNEGIDLPECEYCCIQGHPQPTIFVQQLGPAAVGSGKKKVIVLGICVRYTEVRSWY